MGLGDKGIEGINEFKNQHQCNSICKQLQLPNTGAASNNLAGNSTNSRNIDQNSVLQSEENEGNVIFPTIYLKYSLPQ